MIFADSYFWIALLNDHDRSHALAIRLAARLNNKIFTSEWVLIEVADALADSRKRLHIKPFIDALRARLGFKLIEVSTEQFTAALDLFHERADKQWSLTDCTSFQIMQEHGITEVLTADHHFEQAGFVALMK